MRKILSTLLVAAMLLSLVIVVAVPANAVDGMWDSMGTATQYEEDFEGIPNSRPGYEYTDEGFHMIPAEWKDQSPFGTIQTKEKVDLKKGVYMLIRVDNFTYYADKWFDIHIWDSKNITPGTTTTGEGVQTLIRPSDADANGKPGTITYVNWYTHGFTGAGSSSMAADAEKKDAEGKPLMALTVKWNGDSYEVDINGAGAPAAVIDYMNEKWGGNDSEVYIGFTLQNSNKDGTIECTVLKFGTSKDTATVPTGDDYKDPEEFNRVPVDIMDPDTVPAGQPAIFMNGDRTNSHLMNVPKSATGSTFTINEDSTVHVLANRTMADTGLWNVDYEVSYDAIDFPVMICLTRNLCTCDELEKCYALESCNAYICTGETSQPDVNYQIIELSMCYDAIVKDGNSYLYFYTDLSADAYFDYEGRINGMRFDFCGIDTKTPGKNEFDICWIACFKTIEEAEAYVNEYLGVNDDLPTTEEPSEVPTEMPTTKPTERPSEEPTEVLTEESTEVLTEESTEVLTEEPTESPTEETSETEPKKPGPVSDDLSIVMMGCGSFVGFGAISVIAMAAASMFFLKKRR